MYRSIRDGHPHLWLHATTRLKYGDLLKKTQPKYDDLLRRSRLKYGDLLKETHFKYDYLLMEHVLSIDIYLRFSIHEHFQLWFLIGKNYIFPLRKYGIFYETIYL